MKVLNRYFTRDAKALLIQIQKAELYKQIRQLNKKQQKLFNLMNEDDAEVRQMFNDGVFDNYSTMTNTYFNKLKK